MWSWEKVNVNQSGSSGDLAKIFKNESVKHPGILAQGAPSADATLLAREVIQNSWDAARELRDQLAMEKIDYPGFNIEFTFQNLTSASRDSVVDILDLRAIAQRLDDIIKPDEEGLPANTPAMLGLSENHCLGTLSAGAPLPILRIEEHGGSGMYGPWDGVKSKLYLAMVSVGYTIKHLGSGGSYGFGKAGLIRGSRTRTLVAYTCFRPQDDEPGVTRRLLGMTYWGRHELAGSSFSGFARMGEESEGFVRPLENEAADELAERLGMTIRDPDDPSALGTSFMLIDPTPQPEELNEAICRNWWPAILDREFTVQINPYDDARPLHPKPMQSPQLRPFVEAYGLASRRQDNPLEADERKCTLVSTPLPGLGTAMKLGELGMVADLSDWSYPKYVSEEEDEDGADIKHQSLVALIRGPKMVVEYLEAGRAQPYVRGAFIADSSVDEFLRQTEPTAHDSWQKEVSDGVPAEATAAAAQVLKLVRRRLDEFRASLKPDPPKPEDIRLPELDKLFRKLITGGGGKTPPPPPGPREVSINLEEPVLQAVPDSDQLRLDATAKFSLPVRRGGEDGPDATEREVELVARVRFVEDDRMGDLVRLERVAIDGVEVQSQVDEFRFRKVLAPGQFASLTITTVPYPQDDTCSLVFEGDLVEQGEGGEDE